MELLNDHYFLQNALELAKLHKGSCSPNPSVGAVIVENNKIVASGYHLGPGTSHAEIVALSKLFNKANDTTIYVTLEPCNHWGMTPPCTNALINAGIKRVVYGYRDPNPIVNGQGDSALKAAGIVTDYKSIPEISAFYESYHHWHMTKKPFITGKIAISLDGKIAGKSGERIQITGESLGEFTHSCRKNSDAILTTINTIINDDPQMNARFNKEVIAKKIYILDSELKTPFNAKIFTTAKDITIFHSKKASKKKQELYKNTGVFCFEVNENADGLDLDQIIRQIGKDGIHDLWVEAGAKCFSSFLNKGLLQKAFVYIAPRILNEGINGFINGFDFRAHKIHWQQVGNDVLCEIRW